MISKLAIVKVLSKSLSIQRKRNILTSRIPKINNNINIYYFYSYCLKFEETVFFQKILI
jgi:hypothetical protein